MIGSGKYDAEARRLLVRTEADAILLIVLRGDKGEGCSLAVNPGKINPDGVVLALPALLRGLADSIEKEGLG